MKQVRADALKVLVLGAGFGGVRAALDLSKKNTEVTLVNNTPYHCFHADLYEIVSTKLKHEDKLSYDHLISTVNIPLEEIFKDRRVNLLIDKVESVDVAKKSVQCSNQTLHYDQLIMALGSETNYFDIPGARDFSHPFKNSEDALNVHNDLEEMMRSKQSIRVVVGGGGFTGVELAGNLVAFLRKGDKLIIIEAENKLLGGMPAWAQQKALDRLEKLGVDVHLGCPIKEVKKEEIICTKDKIGFDYLIWTAGIKGVTMLDKDQNITQSHIFIIGDQSAYQLNVPAAAWAAVDEAKLIAKGISPAKYHPLAPTFVVPVGKGYALSNVLNLKITGLAGWILKRLVALKYFLSILPLPKAISLWFLGVKIYSG